jgi:hypothetical protein
MLRPQHLISSQVTEEHFCPSGSKYLVFSNLSLHSVYTSFGPFNNPNVSILFCQFETVHSYTR